MQRKASRPFSFSFFFSVIWSLCTNTPTFKLQRLSVSPAPLHVQMCWARAASGSALELNRSHNSSSLFSLYWSNDASHRWLASLKKTQLSIFPFQLDRRSLLPSLHTHPVPLSFRNRELFLGSKELLKSCWMWILLFWSGGCHMVTKTPYLHDVVHPATTPGIAVFICSCVCFQDFLLTADLVSVAYLEKNCPVVLFH